jgi:hypothetical protein
MAQSVLALAIGVLVLIYSGRLIRAIEASSQAAGREIGGPWKWWGDAPSTSRRAQSQHWILTAVVLVLGLTFVTGGVVGVAHSL